MKKAQYFIVLGVISIFYIGCTSIEQNSLKTNILLKEQTVNNNSSEQYSSVNSVNQSNKINGENLVFLGRWQANPKSSDEFTYLAERFESAPNYPGWGVRFSISDTKGNEIYTKNFSTIDAIYEKPALRNGSQLFLEANYGGVNFLKVLSFENGKIVDLIEANETGDEVMYGGGVAVVLQHSSKINNSQEPFQILVTSKEGFTQIFRYKNGKYRFYGNFKQKDIDDFIEKISDKE